ncbi:MAG: LysR family transcriptional regulator [Pseudomonadota bacterium]
MQNLDVNAVFDFLSVARTGSLNRGARQRGVNASTIGRRIEGLERSLGLRLFQRAQTGYALTDEGRGLLEAAERIEAAALDFDLGAKSAAVVRGRVRLATAENLATALLIPALPDLLARHGELTVEIATDIRSTNLNRREADLALRLMRPRHGNVTVKRLGVMRYGLFGSVGYCERRAGDGQSVDLGRAEQDSFIAWAEDYADLPAAAWIDRALSGRQPAVIVTSLQGHIAAAKAGLGLAALPVFLAAGDPSLRHVPSEADAMTQDLWLVIHSDLVASARVRAVADFVEEVVARNHARLMGR